MTLALSVLLFASDPAARIREANDLLRVQKIPEAKREVELALAADPRSVPALTLQGRIAMATGDTATAAQAFARAVEVAPNSAGAQFMLGFFHYVENDFVQAQGPLERARKLGDPRASLFLALTFDGLAKPAEAAALYQDAVRMEERSKTPTVEARVAYARFLFVLGKFDEAQALITKALAANPKSRDAHYEQARLHCERSDDAACLAEAAQALALTGDGVTDRQIHFLLARAYARTGDTERAAKHRREFEAIPPRMVR